MVLITPRDQNHFATLQAVIAAAGADPAFVMLLSERLKPARAEDFSQLQARAAVTAAATPTGETAQQFLAQRDTTRAARYQLFDWQIESMSLSQIQVWPGMDGLPRKWCFCAVPETANYLRLVGLSAKTHRLPKLLALMAVIDPTTLIDWLGILPLPVLPYRLLHGKSTEGRAPWALDDGCNRAVVLSLLGVETVTVLAGRPKRLADQA